MKDKVTVIREYLVYLPTISLDEWEEAQNPFLRGNTNYKLLTSQPHVKDPSVKVYYKSGTYAHVQYGP